MESPAGLRYAWSSSARPDGCRYSGWRSRQSRWTSRNIARSPASRTQVGDKARKAASESCSIAPRYSSFGAAWSVCKSVVSSVAAARISRLRRPTSGFAYLAAITSPCSVTRIWSRTAPDRATSSVEEPQRHPMPAENLHEVDLGLVEFPAGGQEPSILVAVGVPEHDLLGSAAALQKPPVLR